jgi:large subunit ribosomal protein L15
VKLLGNGELKKKLTVRVHAISATAREKVEAAGGTVSLLREPKPKKAKAAKPKPVASEPEPEEAPAEEAAAEEAAAAEEE